MLSKIPALKVGDILRIKGKTYFLRNKPIFTKDQYLFYLGKQDDYFYANYQTADSIEKLEGEEERTALASLPLEEIGTSQNDLLFIGSDPEIFVVDENGEVIPAFNFLGPKLEGSGVTHHKPYWDGFQGEFTVGEGYCHAGLVSRIREGLDRVLQAAIKINKKATLTHKSVVEVPKGTLKTAPNKFVQFGCSPSENVYGEPPLTELNGRDIPIRFAGFHIHYGFNNWPYHQKINDELAIPIVKTIDRIGMVIITSLLDGLEDPRRRQYYGKAGEYRLPAHGLEYRAPSATCMVHPVVTNLVLDLCRFSWWMNYCKVDERWVTEGDEQIRHVINNLDVAEARRILAKNMAVLEDMVVTIYESATKNPEHKAMIMDMLLNGAKNHISLNMINNWYLADNSWKGYSSSVDASVITASGMLNKFKERSSMANVIEETTV